MQVSEFLVVACSCCIILSRSALGQNNEVSSRNSPQDGKVTVNFGDLVIEVKPPQGREGFVNTQPIYERWENVDDVTYWESIYGSMDDIPAFEDLPDIPGETVELQYVKEWDEEDPEEKSTDIINDNQPGVPIKNFSGRDDRSTIESEITRKSSNPGRCERINPLFSTVKSWNREKRDISVSQEEETDAEEARKSDPNRKRKGRTLSLLQNAAGKSRLKSNWRSDYLYNKYGRKTFRPYKYERGSSVDDCTDDYGITGAAASAKFVDSAINAVELVNSGIAKTSQVVAGTIVNGARQLAQAKRDVIDLGQEATQAIALGSLNNAAADCTEEAAGVAVATNIDGGLEVVGNSVLDTNSGIINAGTDTAVSVGITTSLDAETKAGVDTVVSSVLDNDPAVGAEIISNAVAESNIAITLEKPEEIAVAENEHQIDLQEAEIVGETLVTQEIVANTLATEEIVGGTLVPEIVGNPTVVETPVLESGIAVNSQVAAGVEVVSGAETSLGSALKVNAESEAHTSLNAEISTGSKAEVEAVKDLRHEADPRVLGSHDLSYKCADSAEYDRDREVCLRRRYYADYEDEREYGRRFPGRSRYRPNSHQYGSSRAEIHADAAIHSSLDAGIGVGSNGGSITAATAASADVNANVGVGSSGSSIHADAGVHSSLNSAVGINSGHHGGGLHAGAKSSVGVDSHLDIGRTRSGYRTHGYDERFRHPEECDSVEDIYDFDSEEYQEFKRRFPDARARGHSIHSGIHADAGIRSSVATGSGINANHGSIHTATAASVGVDSNLNVGTSNSGLHAESGIHAEAGISSSVATGSGINANHASIHTATAASVAVDSNLNVGTSNSGVHAATGIHADAAISSSMATGSGINANHGSIHTAAAASVGVDSNLNVGTSNSGVHAASGVHASVNTGLDINSGVHGGGLHAGTKSSLNADSHLDIGRTGGLRSHGGNRRIYDDIDRNRDFCDCEDYEDYLEYRRRYPDMREPDYPELRSGIHADAGIRAALNTGGSIQSNHGSIQTGSAASLNIDTNLDAGISKSSGIHAQSAAHASVDSGLEVNSGNRAGLHAGARSSLDVDSHLNIGRNGLGTLERNRIYGDFNRNEDVCECEDSEEYREYRRRYPGGRFRTDNRGLHNSGTHANVGIHTSVDSSVDVKTGLHGAGASSGVHASSGIHSSLDAEGESRLHVGRANFAGPNGRHRGYQRGEDRFAEYDDYDDEREYGRFSPARYRDNQRGVHSGIHAASGIHGSVATGVDINAGSAGGLQAGAKASASLDSHLDIGTSTSAVNGANSRHAINSAIRADAGIHTSLDTDVNAAGHLHGGMKSSLAVDSHLDVGSRTNVASGAIPRSEIMADVNGPDGELGEKICEAACRGSSDFREHDSCPHSRFEPTGRDGPSYICENCRRRLNGGTNHFCPNCGGGNEFGERLPFLSSGTIYHFDGLKQNCKRTADSSEDIEPHPETTRGFKRYINLDANCSDEAFRQSPDCQNLDYNLQMPRDGNPVSLGIVRTHLSHGHDIALDMHDRARSLVAGGLHPYPHTASMLHFFHSKVPDDLVKLNEESELTLFGTKLLQHKLSVDHNITPNNFLEFLNHHGVRVTGDRICRGRQKRCGGYDKFRSLDGSCNNVAHPTWGQSNRAFARILPARYSDGIHGMPVSVTGAELPNPRKLSVRIYSRDTKLDPELTLAVMQWGQTLAHDLGRQVMDQTTNGGIECCADNGKRHLPKSLQHHSCAPITISPRDKFYSIHGQRCMNFVRAMTVVREDCTLGPADQLNGATSFLDCSSMYGPNKATSDELREFSGGRMKLEFRSGRWMLPTTTNQSNFCDIFTSDDVCYRTGDPRNNQNPQLVILQTMLVREHNRIADGLKALNSEWNDERIFQESRRIVIAEYQHITYNEWLPLLLGRRYVKKHGLNRTESGMSSAYNERINPTTIIGFTSGAFRSLHSMIEGDIGLCNVGGKVIDSLRLSDHYFRPKVIEKRNNFEHLLRGLVSQRMQGQDMNLDRELTEYLFRSRNDYGMDLAAIDIQRGRDHGVPSYNAYRKICRLEPANDFDDLSEEISWENIEKLRRDYAHVDDIDLIVGATMENRAPGSLFGPINRCLIGEQFYRSRVGDRYFYDNANLPHSFTPEQFHEITKVTLSRLMCDMGGAVVMVQRNAFRAISPKNPLVPCEDLPKLDLTLWME